MTPTVCDSDLVCSHMPVTHEQAGGKGKIANKVAKKRLDMTPPEIKRKQIEEFLSPRKTATDTKPEFNLCYSESLNLVDRFNSYISMIACKHRFATETKRIVIGLIEICAVESCVLYQDLNETTMKTKFMILFWKFVLDC